MSRSVDAKYRRSGSWIRLGLSLLAFALAAGGSSSQAREAKRERTVGEWIQQAKRASVSPRERTEAIRELGRQSDAQKLRDQHVIEELLAIAKSPKNDMFVRLEAIQVLGDLEIRVFRTDHFAKNRFLVDFIDILKDKEEVSFIRAAVCKIFGQTLESKGVRDEQALNLLLSIVEDPEAGHPRLAQPLTVRVEATEAVGQVGDPKAFKAISNLLLDPRADQLLRESAVRALYNLLTTVEDLKDEIKLPTINRLKEMVEGKDVPLEIKAEVMKALARLYRHGVKGMEDAMLAIRMVVEKEAKTDLVVAGVLALGIAGKVDALPVLIKSFGVYYDKDNPTHPKDSKIRTSVMETMGYLLSAQVQDKSQDDVAVKKIVDLLLKALDPNAENSEFDSKQGGKFNSEVVMAAIFSLRYIYPTVTPFKEHHKSVADRLIYLLKVKPYLLLIRGGLKKPEELDPKATAKEQFIFEGADREEIVKTLYYLTQQPFGDDTDRWDRWFDKTYPGGNKGK